MKIVIGIDPGAGSRSATGVCVLNASTKTIVDVYSIWPTTRKSPAYERIRDISGQFLKITAKHQKDDCMMVNESFVMRGKGGETLQRLIGSLYACSPDSFDVCEISNMKLKQVIGVEGTGKSDKVAVGKGVINWFAAKNNHKDAEYIMELMEQNKWDAIDAVAIAIVGLLTYG